MLSRSNWLILGLAVLAAAAGGYMQHRSAPPAAGASMVGQSLPDLVLPGLDGEPHRLSDYRGRRVLLNLWASWCGPCLREMPELAKIQAKFGDRAPVVVGIAIDEADRARAYLARHPVNYPILLGSPGSPDTSSELGNRAGLLPYSVLIDADERILATQAGPIPAARLAQWFGP